MTAHVIIPLPRSVTASVYVCIDGRFYASFVNTQAASTAVEYWQQKGMSNDNKRCLGWNAIRHSKIEIKGAGQ